MVWTSTLQRTITTAAKLRRPAIRWRQLDEIDAGVCDGMSYEEVAEKLPQEWRARKADKFNYRSGPPAPHGGALLDVGGLGRRCRAGTRAVSPTRTSCTAWSPSSSS